MKETDLKSCPFCGCGAIYNITREDEIVGDIPQLFCNGCKMTFEVENDSPYLNDRETFNYLKEKLYETWNRRAEEYAPDINVGNNDGWIPCRERLPEDDRKEYIVQKTNGSINILGFTKDAYKLSRYDFDEYKGKKKPIFYDYDSEYGYIELECVAWMPLPAPYQPKGE